MLRDIRWTPANPSPPPQARKVKEQLPIPQQGGSDDMDVEPELWKEEQLPQKGPAITPEVLRGGGARNAAGHEFHRFLREKGGTEGCRACSKGAKGREHSKMCKERRKRWREEENQEARGTKRKAEEMEGSESEKDDEPEHWQPPQDEDMQLDVMGPPWFSELGEQLEEELVKAGMEDEENNLRRFSVFEEIEEEDLEADEKPISTRWILTRKGERVKARVVVQQVRFGSPGSRFDELDVYAAAPTLLGQRILFWWAILHDWRICQADLKAAFLHVPIPAGHKRIIIRPPQGLRRGKKLWLLLKMLYGLREAPRFFQQWLRQQLISIGFVPLQLDPQLYALRDKKTNEIQALLTVFADDILLTGNSQIIESLQQQVSSRMTNKWLPELTEGAWRKYLGRELCRGPGCLYEKLSDEFCNRLVAEAGTTRPKKVAIPINKVSKKNKHKATKAALLTGEYYEKFRRVVGMLLWCVRSRPDVAFAIKELSRKVSKSTVCDWAAMLQVVRYMSSTRNIVLKLEIHPCPRELLIEVFSDSDWASTLDGKATSGGAMTLNGTLLSTWSRTQPVVSLSSCEAELIAATIAGTEANFLRNMLGELGVQAKVKILVDNQSTGHFTRKVGPGRMRHISVRYMWLQQQVRHKEMTVENVAGAVNTADIFTKPLERTRFEMLRYKVGLEATEKDKEHGEGKGEGQPNEHQQSTINMIQQGQ